MAFDYIEASRQLREHLEWSRTERLNREIKKTVAYWNQLDQPIVVIDLYETGDYYNSLKGVTTGINKAGVEVITGVERGTKN